VDDLVEIGDLEQFIASTYMVAVYCSKGYFQSANCMRELTAATTLCKPAIPLLDPDASRGGLTANEIHNQLLEANQRYANWGFSSDVPQGEALYCHLFEHNVIEWNRLGCFQVSFEG
jgi:hypothetical protein